MKIKVIIFMSIFLILGGIITFIYIKSKCHTVKHESVLNPGNIYKLSPVQIKLLEQKAVNHDLDAMERLGDYYCLYLGDDKQGFYWYEKAAFAGSRNLRELIVSKLLDSKSKDEQKRGEELRKKWSLPLKGSAK